MLKYLLTDIVFQEIPDEVTLAIAITGCGLKCPGCHSMELWEDKGTPLTIEEINRLLEEYKGITCVCFMGNGGSIDGITELNVVAKYIHEKRLKTALYSGYEKVPLNMVDNFDYVKFGPYRSEYGGLAEETTNQRFYIIRDRRLWDYTPLFWKDYKMVYPDYFISSSGKLWSSYWGNYISPCLNEKGYEKVKIQVNGKSLSTFVHRLVALAFIPNPHNLPQINHKNEIKADNRVENLEWCDNDYNTHYGSVIINRRNSLLDTHGEPVVQLSLDGTYIREFTSPNQVKRILGYSDGLIRNCCKGGCINSHNKKYYPLYEAYGYKWKFKKDYEISN